MPPALSTIFALSSGRPPAAIAVVRISGPRAGDALQQLAGRLPAPRQAALVRVREPRTGETIDEALALWFPAPHSETGEDIAELQLHGGRAVIAAVLSALGGIAGLRPAEAGEFTRRAFLNGRLDLTQVEAIADLVAAETQAQRRQAFGHLKGLLGDRAESWRQRLIEALALVEAGIDFSDEADVPAGLLAPALAAARALAGEIGAALAQPGHAERLREGLVVAIAGPPNAGKSTLLNRIARREAAIVSPFAGTTRDVIEVHLELAGYPVTLLDTAGIRESDDPIEQEGVRRARARAAAADLVLWVADASEQGRAHDIAREVGGAAAWVVLNKIDLIEAEQKRLFESQFEGAGAPVFSLAAASGRGLEPLLERLTRHAADFFGAGETALIVRARHRHALQETHQALERALGEEARGREDILAEELRLAARALGRLTGRVDVEDVLEHIFKEFCIGK